MSENKKTHDASERYSSAYGANVGQLVWQIKRQVPLTRMNIIITKLMKSKTL